MSKYYWILLLTAIVAVGCTSKTERMQENAVYEKCVIVKVPFTNTELSDKDNAYTTYHIKRISDGITFMRVLRFNSHYHESDTILVKFDKRYDYESI